MEDTASRGRALRLVCTTAGVGLLAAQLVAVLYAHVVQPAGRPGGLERAWNGCSAEPTSCTRYFAWAPNDYLVRYELSVVTGGRTLGHEAARLRYGLGEGPWEFPVEQLQDIIRQYEKSYAPGQAEVTLRYAINQRGWSTWRWQG